MQSTVSMMLCGLHRTDPNIAVVLSGNQRNGPLTVTCST
jgi:hypothetical protein